MLPVTWSLLPIQMLDIRPIDRSPGGLEEIRGLLNLVFPSARYSDTNYLDWAYNANPLGPAIGSNAYAEDKLIAHFAGQPMRARTKFHRLELTG